jgi:hypothetical protein
LGITPADVIDAITQFADEAVEYLIQRRRRLNVLTYIQNSLVYAGKSVASASRYVRAGITAVANSMLAGTKQLNERTCGGLAYGMANIGCPAVMYAIKAGISALMPGIIVPYCIVSWFSHKCKEGVAMAFKRARLLRRLNALRRDIVNF